MYTCADIVQQNQQDAFSAMFLCLGREILALCGTRAGEGVIREAVRRAGRRDGQRQLERLRELCGVYGMFQVSGEDINSPRQSFVIRAMEDPRFQNLIDAAWRLIDHETTGKPIRD